MKKTKITIAIFSALTASSALATNGMNMEGYGAISAAMGGTAQAYNNGLGGMMNNPATMGMGSKAGNKLQLGLGELNPTISSEHKQANLKTDSSGSFIMPGLGYATKSNGFTWGVGVLAQGGMGTDYAKADLTGANKDLFAFGNSMTNTGNQNPANMTTLSGETIRSEVAVGRFIVPLVFEINDQFTVGGSIDYVWGGMDLQMDMDGATFGKLMQDNGGSVGGSMANSLGQSFGNGAGTNTGPLNDVNWARFDFSDDSNFTQATKGAGFAGKLGALFKINKHWTLGASYHLKTAMSDFEGDASMSMNVNVDPAKFQGSSSTYSNQTIDLKGKIKIKDFQWPEMMAVGATWRPNDKWMVSADVKQINWSAVMKEFSMSFKADPAASQVGLAQGFGGQVLDVTMDQNWKDQTVVMLGGQFMATKNLALRAGYNYASNPVPKEDLNPLFPATIETHYTAGLGWTMVPGQKIDVALTVAPEVSVTSPANGITTNHSQFNWQLLYTYAWGIKK